MQSSLIGWFELGNTCFGSQLQIYLFAFYGNGSLNEHYYFFDFSNTDLISNDWGR